MLGGLRRYGQLYRLRTYLSRLHLPRSDANDGKEKAKQKRGTEQKTAPRGTGGHHESRDWGYRAGD
jgi:hypothetical protein